MLISADIPKRCHLTFHPSARRRPSSHTSTHVLLELGPARASSSSDLSGCSRCSLWYTNLGAFFGRLANEPSEPSCPNVSMVLCLLFFSSISYPFPGYRDDGLYGIERCETRRDYEGYGRKIGSRFQRDRGGQWRIQTSEVIRLQRKMRRAVFLASRFVSQRFFKGLIASKLLRFLVPSCAPRKSSPSAIAPTIFANSTANCSDVRPIAITRIWPGKTFCVFLTCRSIRRAFQDEGISQARRFGSNEDSSIGRHWSSCAYGILKEDEGLAFRYVQACDSIAKNDKMTVSFLGAFLSSMGKESCAILP